MKVALVYDRVNKWGGAERLLSVLNKIFPEAPLYTSLYSRETAPWASIFPRVIPSFLQKLPGASLNHDKLAIFMPLAFESFDFSDFDLVISVTSESAKGILTPPATKHLCICLTPTRYLWSGYDDYFNTSVKKRLAKPFVRYLKEWDLVASRRPDVMVAISREVQGRIKRYYDQDSILLYPPVSQLKIKNEKFKINISNYYLVVSRLVPYKRIDLVIRAFNDLGWPLVIVGTGSELEKLRHMAKKNIYFAGQLTESELANYYYNCRALILPQKEDFGLVSLEAQSLGKPVIALSAGGAKETVIKGKTGLFFDRQTKKSLLRALDVFEYKAFGAREIKKNASRFSEQKFEECLKKIIKNTCMH